MGDTATRLDRYEPDLGLVLSADLRDTTSPLAMAHLVRRITTGDLLQNSSRERLLQWMQDTRTGPNRLRAGLPAEWRSGNKTGTGRTEGTTNRCNDVAITFPPGRPPVIIAGYFDSGEYIAQVERRHEAVLAVVGRIAAQWAIGELRRSPDRAQQFPPSPVRVSRIPLHSRAMCASNWPRRTG
jgi:beta-lactamase class A